MIVKIQKGQSADGVANGVTAQKPHFSNGSTILAM
jgi:hypothetical protein